MILKSFDIEKINLNKFKIILLYGKNEGLKNETINKINKEKVSVFNYDEKEIINNPNIFIDDI